MRVYVGVPLFWETAIKPLLNRTMAFVVAGSCRISMSVYGECIRLG